MFGIAEGEKVANNNDTGETYKGLSGNFAATNSKGEEFRANVLYLPLFVQDIIVSRLKASDGAVEFAFEVSVRIAKEGERAGPQGYLYEVRPLIQPAPKDDPLVRLMEAAKKKALPKAE